MPDPDAPTSTVPSGSGAAWLLGIVGAFVLYLLSPGVFAVFYHLGATPPPWLNNFFTPIAWACQESSFVSLLYDAYLRFLGDLI
jgi:hypothetical protein